jgi:hypothetical protein
MERIEMESYKALVVKASSCVTEEGKEIGMGLFAGINYRSTQKIAYSSEEMWYHWRLITQGLINVTAYN